MHAHFKRRGFLPAQDPARSFTKYPELRVLDRIGRDLPSLLEDNGFRDEVKSLALPPWPESQAQPETLPELRLYYVRIGFLASAYINQVSRERANVLPKNIAVPLCHACRLLRRPPILSYDGYALFNWKRFQPNKAIALGNIDTIQNFVHLYDEHWFILIHVEIEALAAHIYLGIDQAQQAFAEKNVDGLNAALQQIGQTIWHQVDVLKRIPEKMDPSIYYRKFRPYIRFFEDVHYEGVDKKPTDYRGETGAQSSIMPSLIAFMKIAHKQSALTDHLRDMRHFMPVEHRELIDEIQTMPDVRDLADKEFYNDILEAMAMFREVHFGWAQEYINKWVDDPRGTGGTPYMKWLKQLIDETREHKIP